MKYSFLQGLQKALKNLILFALPFAISYFTVHFPNYANLTIGGVLVMLENYAKTKYGGVAGAVKKSLGF